MTTNTLKGPIEGYLQVEPVAVRDGNTVTIDAQSVYYKQVNAAIRAAFADGATKVVLNNVNLKSQDNYYYYQSYYHRDNYRSDEE